MVPLTFTAINETNTISEVKGKPEVKRRLEDMGFVVGSPIKIVSSINENLIVCVKGTRVALDKTLANKIFVS